MTLPTPTPNPGLQQQEKVRSGARILAIALGVIGVILGAVGLSQFLAGWGNLTMADPDWGTPTMSGPGPGSILLVGAGGFCLVAALAAANVGWMRAGARYTAGETMPVVKDAAAYLSDGRGLGAIGRTDAASGPFCRQCGVQAGAGDRFCGSCGTTLS